MITEKNLIISAILHGKYKPVAYYTYPTGTVGSSYLFEQTQDKIIDRTLWDIVENIFDDAVASLNIKRDNKTAIRICVEGYEGDVYLSYYDNRHVICKEISTNRGGSELVLDDNKSHKKTLTIKNGKIQLQSENGEPLVVLFLATDNNIDDFFALWLAKQDLPFDSETNKKVEQLLHIAFVNGAKTIRNDIADLVDRIEIHLEK